MNGFWMNEFEKKFDVYEEVIRKEIEKDTNINDKLPKIQSLIFILHGFCIHRFSTNYGLKAKKFLDEIKSFEKDKNITNKNVISGDRVLYWGVLMEWFAAMVEERYSLVSNLQRVDFGGG